MVKRWSSKETTGWRTAFSTVSSQQILDGDPHPHSRAMESALQCGLADAEDGGGLLGAEPLNVAEHEWCFVFQWQRGYGLVECRRELAMFGVCCRSLPGICRLDREVVKRSCSQTSDAMTPAVRSVGLVQSDPIEPGGECRLPLKLRQATPCAKECLLGDLACIVIASHEMAHGGVELIGVTRNQLFKCGGITVARGRHKVVV